MKLLQLDSGAPECSNSAPVGEKVFPTKVLQCSVSAPAKEQTLSKRFIGKENSRRVAASTGVKEEQPQTE